MGPPRLSGRPALHFIVLDIPRQPLQLIDEQEGVHRRNLEAFCACFTHHLVVNADQVVA